MWTERFIQDEIRDQRRQGQRVDQGRCCSTWSDSLSCPRCFFRNRGEPSDA